LQVGEGGGVEGTGAEGVALQEGEIGLESGAGDAVEDADWNFVTPLAGEVKGGVEVGRVMALGLVGPFFIPGEGIDFVECNAWLENVNQCISGEEFYGPPQGLFRGGAGRRTVLWRCFPPSARNRLRRWKSGSALRQMRRQGPC